MRITIPENIQTYGEDTTCITVLSALQCNLECAKRVIVDRYRGKYPINDLTAFELGSYVRIITNLRSLLTLCQIGEDYNSCCTLARSIADSICTLKLIYQSPSAEDIYFRHYLYILDGISERNKLLETNIANNGKITTEEYEQLTAQCSNAKHNCEEIIAYCETFLSKHPFSTKFKNFAKHAIKTRTWKYKEHELTKNGKVPVYSWKEMYHLLDSRDSIVSMFSSYFSQFVHGLSISCIAGLDDEDNIDSIASIGVCLQGQVLKRVENLLGKESIRKAITDEDLRYLFSLYSPEKLVQFFNDAFKRYRESQSKNFNTKE